jgi:hypothetical protein
MVIIGLLTLSGLEAHAQPAGPELASGKFELGLNIERNHRNVRPRVDKEIRSGLADIFFRYGLNRWLTVSGEGIIGRWDFDPSLEGDFRVFVIGAGMTAGLGWIKGYGLAAVIRYVERFDFDSSVDPEHLDIRGTTVAVLVERSYKVGKNIADIWLGPGYFFDQYTYYHQYWFRADRQRSYRNLGFDIGANIVLIDHVKPYLHLVYANYLQPRFGVGYVF